MKHIDSPGKKLETFFSGSQKASTEAVEARNHPALGWWVGLTQVAGDVMRTLSIAESGCRGRSLQGRQRDAVPDVDDESVKIFAQLMT